MPKQILLADDSLTIHRMVEITFANEDYQVTAVKSGEEALERARQLKPDLLLADASMPGKSGYDLCGALRSDDETRGIPCLILAGNSSPYDEARGTQVGADGFVVKPFDTQALIDKVAEAIARRTSGAAVGVSAATPAKTPATPSPSIPAASATPRPVPVPQVPPLPVAAASIPVPASRPTADTVTAEPAWRSVPMTQVTPPRATPLPGPAPIAARPPLPAQPAALGRPAPAPPSVNAPRAAMPQTVPQMPRASMIPHIPAPTPSPRATTPARPVPPIIPATGASANRPVGWVTPAVADPARAVDPEMVARLSREVIERIAWEVVPELAETIIREQLDRLMAQRQK